MKDKLLLSEDVLKNIIGHMKIGASKASKIANVARSTIYKDMDEGRLSFDIGAKGKKVIDISELERVYGNLNTPDNKKTSEDVREKQRQTDKKDNSDNNLSVEVKMLREQILRIDQMNERERTNLEKQIDDLRTDRDKWQGQANKLLLTYESHQEKEQGEDNKALLWLLPLLAILFVALIGFSVYVFASS